MLKEKIKKMFVIIILSITLVVNSIGFSYMKPIQTQAAEVVIAEMGIELLVELLLGVVLTVSGLVVVDKADEVGVFDDLYYKYMTDGSSALKDMPDYNEDEEIAQINGKIIYMKDFVKKGSGNNKRPDLNDEDIQRAINATSINISARLLENIVDFTQENLNPNSDIESVKEYYKIYGKEEKIDINEDEEEIVYIDNVEQYNQRPYELYDSNLCYDGIAKYYTYESTGATMRVFNIFYENYHGLTEPSESVNESFFYHYGGTRVIVSDDYMRYGGRVAIYPENSQSDEPWKMRIYYQKDLITDAYDYKTDSVRECYTIGCSRLGNFASYNSATGVDREDYFYANYVKGEYPTSDIPVFTNTVDGARYLYGWDDASNAINLAFTYVLPCDFLEPNVKEMLKPLTDKDIEASALPQIIEEVTTALQPETQPDTESAIQPNEVPDKFPIIVDDIITTVTTPTVIPDPAPKPVIKPKPFPVIKPEPIETEDETIKNTADKSIGLQNVFPFCIPFDLIELINVMNVDAQAPYFEYPIYIQGVCDEKIIIDFSDYDDLAEIIRTFETLFFILGLILLTRNIIRG